jgi:hypothetical protein
MAIHLLTEQPTAYIHREDLMSKRVVIEPHKGDKRYARRDAQGQFTDSQVNVGRSLAADRRSKSKTVASKGQGDRGRPEEKLKLLPWGELTV